MGKILFGIIAVVASFMLVDSLVCNKCSYGVLGFCLNNAEVTCDNTTEGACFTGKATFTSLTNVGFNTQGCRALSGCNVTTNSTLIGLTYETKITCCETDKCNPVTISGAPSAKMTFTAALGAAVVASMLGSML